MTVVLMPVTVNAIQRATNLEDANEDEALCGSEERLYLDYLNPILLINAPLRSVLKPSRTQTLSKTFFHCVTSAYLPAVVEWGIFLSMNLVISHLCAWW